MTGAALGPPQRPERKGIWRSTGHAGHAGHRVANIAVHTLLVSTPAPDATHVLRTGRTAAWGHDGKSRHGVGTHPVDPRPTVSHGSFLVRQLTPWPRPSARQSSTSLRAKRVRNACGQLNCIRRPSTEEHRTLVKCVGTGHPIAPPHEPLQQSGSRRLRLFVTQQSCYRPELANEQLHDRA